jgi:hypothetical protein
MLHISEVTVVQNYLEMLATLTRERLAIERRMSDVERSLRSILALHDDDEVMPYMEALDNILQPEGFTDAVRKVMRNTFNWLTPAQVKQKLPAAGFSVEEYSNPLASVHTILKRLHNAGELESQVREGKTVYKRKTLIRAVQAEAAKQKL